MKGFGIEIKNDLLDPKHIGNMGVAVWMYMWCIDKMTSINEDGVGKILGGKPIKFEDIGDDLGIPMRTYRRWIVTLKKYGYINLQRTPYGIIISVNKAHKHFGKRYAKSGTSLFPDVPETAHLSDKSGTSNKTIQLDSTINTIATEVANEFSFKDEIKKMEDSPRRDINIIALYLDVRKPDLKNKEQLNVAIKRHLRPAQALKSFTDDQILMGVEKAKKLTSEWVLETVVKTLTK